jgi:biotin carboxyl carrier protein
MTTVISNIGDKQFKWSFTDNGSVLLDGNKIQIDLQIVSSQRVSVLYNGKSFHATIDRNDFIFNVSINGTVYKIGLESSTKEPMNQWSHVSQKKYSSIEIRSPMPGMVVRCEVEEGTRIKVGDGLIILEAMKMENEIRATKEGTVKKVLVHDRQVVDKGELLLLIE